MDSFNQKILRNLKENDIIFKADDLVDETNNLPKISWTNNEDVDEFFSFARKLNTNVFYVVEGELVDEDEDTTQQSILQIGFVHQSIMHYMSLTDDSEDEDENEESEDENEYELEDEYIENNEEINSNEEYKNNEYQKQPVDNEIKENEIVTDDYSDIQVEQNYDKQ
jgi:hypothetical protein